MFLMHRVELKALLCKVIEVFGKGFLMHRVELKAPFVSNPSVFKRKVPNAPCGVESRIGRLAHLLGIVPNAPCGVERKHSYTLSIQKEIPFLVRRVELKVWS